MSQSKVLDSISMKANSSFAAKQFLFAYVVGDQLADVCSAASNDVIGVIQDNPVSGAMSSIAVAGTTKIVLGDTVTAGTRVMSKSDGTAIPKSGACYSAGKVIHGGVAGDIVEMIIEKMYFAS